MEVDGGMWPGEGNYQEPENEKFNAMKEFVTAAREFHATHSEGSISAMTRCLGHIVSTCDLSIFAPGRPEVCSFFSSLWQVMNDTRAPHWAGVTALARAAKEPNARHALTHTYKFLPVLVRLLSDSITLEKKMRLLSLIQDISYGTKISWQESYLPGLLKQLTDWVTTSTSTSSIGRCSLSILVNICQGNPSAMLALHRTIDAKQFVTRLLNMKDDGYGGVEVCRLLLCLSGGGRTTFSSQRHVHSFLSVATTTMITAIGERDPSQLQHVHMLLSDLLGEPSTRLQVIAYPHLVSPLTDVIKSSLLLCTNDIPEGPKPGLEPECLQHVLNSLTLLVKLELYSLRVIHPKVTELGLTATRLSLAPALLLICSVLSQYKEEGRLPHELMQLVSENLASLLVPPVLEAGKAGMPWLSLVGLLVDFTDLQDRLVHNLSAAAFEESLFTILFNLNQNGAPGAEDAQTAAVMGVRAALALAPLHKEWDAALVRLLAQSQVSKLLCTCLSSAGSRRRQVLQLVKHPHFPPDKIHQVFGSSEQRVVDGGLMACEGAEEWGGAGRDHAVDAVMERLTRALDKQQISDVTTSSVMELYAYKMSYHEMRQQSQNGALKAAAEQTASLQHSVAMLQATNNSQQDLLYDMQLNNERLRDTSERLTAQLEDAEKSMRGFRAKLASERLDKDNQLNALNNTQRAQTAALESEIKLRKKELNDKEKVVEKLQTDLKTVNNKLAQQTSKNTELAGVLVKFEERVKARDRKLEEVGITEAALRKDLDTKDQTIKQLEKTILERENRLYQVTSQLEEMKRVQDMVTKLMTSGKTAGS